MDALCGDAWCQRERQAYVAVAQSTPASRVLTDRVGRSQADEFPVIRLNLPLAMGYQEAFEYLAPHATHG